MFDLVELHQKVAPFVRTMLLVFAVLSLGGCGQNGAAVDYHAGGQTVTITDAKNGDVTAEMGATAVMPTDLPAWTPQYPGSTIIVAQVQHQSPDHGRIENVTMQTPDSLSKVSAFYDQKIAAAGLRLMHAGGDAEATTRLVVSSSGTISVGVVKNDDDGGSLISISRMNTG